MARKSSPTKKLKLIKRLFFILLGILAVIGLIYLSLILFPDLK